MSQFTPVFLLINLPPDTLRRVEIKNLKIVVARTDDGIYALEDRCSHEDYNLSDGWIEEKTLCCPMHGAKFNLKTGQPETPPAHEPIKTFPVQVKNGVVEIDIEQE